MSRRPPSSTVMSPPRRPRRASVKLFISYSHSNKIWMNRLKPLLDGFQYDERVTAAGASLNYLHVWHDRELKAGTQWDGSIKLELAQMDIFVPLVSTDFFASWYIQNVELPAAIKRHNRGEIKVVPIFLYKLDLLQRCSFLHGFPSFPESDKCWSSYGDRRNAHSFIDNGLWGAINEVLKIKAGNP